ncbi:MAG: hypothetical protein ACTSW4_01605 [Candidatus Ranarchaeia archaeon]
MENAVTRTAEDGLDMSSSNESAAINVVAVNETALSTRLSSMPFFVDVLASIIRVLFFSSPFVSAASIIPVAQSYLELAITTSVPPAIQNFFVIHVFFLIVSIPLAVFCMILFNRDNYLTPAYTSILIGTILIGLNSPGIGIMLFTAGASTYVIASLTKKKRLDTGLGLKRL